jgi:hypothetical protein
MSGMTVLQELASIAWSVALAVVPLTVFFAVFQVLFLRLPRSEVARTLTGTAVASAGLFLFLLGMEIGLLPFGKLLGEAMGALRDSPLLVPLAMVLGFVTTWGEPSVRVLASQVEQASAGSMQGSFVLVAVCIGVAVAVGLGMYRVAHEIPLLWLLAPGYALVVVLLRFVDQAFMAVAVDAGGVATGPLANTFLLAVAIGASSQSGQVGALVHGLGLVSLIALAPVVSVMVLGVAVRRREHRKEE